MSRAMTGGIDDRQAEDAILSTHSRGRPISSHPASRRPMKTLPILLHTVASRPDLPLSATGEPPWYHVIAGKRPLVLLVEGSQIFAVEREFANALQSENPGAESALQTLRQPRPVAKTGPAFPAAPTAVSLNLAQVCNLSCSYCYADEGLFGGRPRMMSEEVARRIIDNLLVQAGGEVVTVGFIGGEPLLNRQVLRASVVYASEQGKRRGVTVRFSITTNATLLGPEDLALFRDYAFTVSVSLDGGATVNDRYRRSRGSRDNYGSYDRAVAALRRLLENPGRAKLAARATIARTDLAVAEKIAVLAALGFLEIGVSPLRTSPDPSLALGEADWPVYLAEMIRAAEQEKRRLRRGEPPRFSNFVVALKELHRGACRPLPCGAAANYVSVDADGNYSTCHRTVGDPRFSIGDLSGGPSRAARLNFLEARHVDRQQPCASCWARYLCGGGCHAEVAMSGRNGCDYIRGWLEYCLRSYGELAAERHTFFNP